MHRDVRELQFTAKPEKPDALFAMKFQEILGGQFGEMTVMMQYLWQGRSCRVPGKYKGMIMDIGTEEIGHVEMLTVMLGCSRARRARSPRRPWRLSRLARLRAVDRWPVAPGRDHPRPRPCRAPPGGCGPRRRWPTSSPAATSRTAWRAAATPASPDRTPPPSRRARSPTSPSSPTRARPGSGTTCEPAASPTSAPRSAARIVPFLWLLAMGIADRSLHPVHRAERVGPGRLGRGGGPGRRALCGGADRGGRDQAFAGGAGRDIAGDRRAGIRFGAGTVAFLTVYGRGLASLALGLFIVATAARTPFTAQLARAAVPEPAWHTPGFLRVIRQISLAWGSVVLILGACHPRRGLPRGAGHPSAAAAARRLGCTDPRVPAGDRLHPPDRRRALVPLIQKTGWPERWRGGRWRGRSAHQRALYRRHSATGRRDAVRRARFLHLL
jgi:hypothetical protein